MSLALALHCAATSFMAGVIWVVQVVHYPLMSAVSEAHFVAYEEAHIRRIGRVVVPAMLFELALSVWLVASPPQGAEAWRMAIGLALLGGIWLSTFLLQAPLHQRLKKGYDPRLHALLTRSNWLRTAGWSLRAALALFWLLAYYRA